MPTTSEVEVLSKVEEKILSVLQTRRNVIFLARITCRGTRELIYRVHDPKLADRALQRLIYDNSQLREWEYRMEQDISWSLAVPELALLERGIQFN